jgi:hypothetical protein
VTLLLLFFLQTCFLVCIEPNSCYFAGPNGDNTYIPSDVAEVGCDGKTISKTGTTLKACRECANTCGAREIRVSGCNGTTRHPFATCAACNNCREGEYVTKTCVGGTSLNVTCAPCNQSCSLGHYFVSGCSGNSTTQASTHKLPLLHSSCVVFLPDTTQTSLFFCVSSAFFLC